MSHCPVTVPHAVTVSNGTYAVDIDSTHPLYLIAETIGGGTFDWIGEAVNLLEAYMLSGMTEEEAIAAMNEKGDHPHWSYFYRLPEQEDSGSADINPEATDE